MYSMLVRTSGEAVLPFCEEHGIGVIVHSPLAKGLLTGTYTPDHKFPEDDERSWMAAFQGERFTSALRVADELKAWATGQDHSIVELAIAWTLANTAVTSCIVGAKTPKQAVQNAVAAQWILTADDLEEINQIQGDFRILNLHH
ncbi:MAG: aldo/keto reductase [Anaerolineales bacterium]|nr:MAG: aldo/keto reductase [Anaerolineales bacterium]